MAEDAVGAVGENIKTIFSRVKLIRAILTFVLLAWLVVFTILSLQLKFSAADLASPNTIPEDSNAAKYFYIHRIWFGEESIVMMLFKVWYFTALMFLVGPLIQKGIDYFSGAKK